jgi:cytochrome c oxidase subunit 3
MLITTLLVVVFVIFQVVEYSLAQFTITDGVFGSLFYAGTGLHGFHMITLILMLSTVTVRMYFRTFSRTHSTNLDTTIIYSHVLDVI